MNVKIFGETYKVIVADITNCMGYIELKEKRIYLAKDQPLDEMFHTLIHEMLHGLFHRTSVNQSISYDLEQGIVNNIATMILENPHVFQKKAGSLKKASVK